MTAKYSNLSSNHVFCLVAVETLGALVDVLVFSQRLAEEQHCAQPIPGKPRFCTSIFQQSQCPSALLNVGVNSLSKVVAQL